MYYIAKQFDQPCSPEEFGVALAKHFVKTYPRVSKAKVTVRMTPWQRTSVHGRPHNHGLWLLNTRA